MDLYLDERNVSGTAGGRRAVEALAGPRHRRLLLTNETPHRILIASERGDGRTLQLVGFGNLELTSADVARLDLAPWTDSGLVTVTDVCAGQETDGANWYRPLRGAIDPALRSLTLVLTLAIGVGLPATIAVGRGPDFLRSVALPGILQWAAIAVACVTPAAYYFLFARQRRDLVRETFLRQVLFLDPAVRTKLEAQAKYGTLLDEVYGMRPVPAEAGQRGQAADHGLATPVIVTTLLITAGWLLITLPQPEGSALPGTVRQALTYGFLGSYFFAVNMAFRRYLRADLSPRAYSQIIVRLLTTSLLALVLSAVMAPTGAMAPLYAAAFLAGVVPETAMGIIRQSVAMKILPGSDERHVVTALDGINLYDRSRLLEEGIENVENLAHANLIELMLRTRIPTARLVDLYDQAILYIHLATGDDRPSAEWGRLRRCGIRTATDLVVAEQRLGKADARERDAFMDLLGRDRGVSRLGTILRVLGDDEWMVQLLHWRATFGCALTLEEPCQLEAHLASHGFVDRQRTAAG